MDRSSPALRRMFADIRRTWFQRLSDETWEFATALNQFLYALPDRDPSTWHDELTRFRDTQRQQGRILSAEGEAELRERLNQWARERAAREAARPASADGATPAWPALSDDERHRERNRMGLPDFYAIPFELGDGAWERKIEAVARRARDEMLATCLELQALGAMADGAEGLPGDGIDILAAHTKRVHAAHDKYVQAMIDLERTWLAYIQSTWYVGWQMEKLVLKVSGDLPPRLFDLESSKLKELAEARAETNKALGKVVSRVDTIYTAAVLTDKAITILEIGTVAFGGGLVVFRQAVTKGVAKAVALRAAIKYGIKQLAIQSAVYVAAGYTLPKLVAASGLNQDFVFAGLMVIQGLSTVQGLRSAYATAGRAPADTPVGDVLTPSFEPHPGAIRRNLSGVDNTSRKSIQSTLEDELRLGVGRERGVWDLDIRQRGHQIEDQLGQNLPDGFIVFDKLVDGHATSIKSLDLWGKSYRDSQRILNKCFGYVDDVADFEYAKLLDFEIDGSKLRARSLEIAIPPGATKSQLAALDQVIDYGRTRNVAVEIIVVKE